MKKIVVISDTHGNLGGIEKLAPLMAENDLVVHLGDGGSDLRTFTANFPEKAYVCRGNCDFFSAYPEEGVLEVERIRIFYCHGHTYGVKSGLWGLAREAKRRDCQIALYGHTHTALITELDGVTLVNPGSLKRAVGEGGSYCYLVVNKEKFTPVLVGESAF
ncbi:MAG: metallophosphoesterase [Clostridia bacterium]|nr:metallophosphoesterase [Clostridia bacterium]